MRHRAHGRAGASSEVGLRSPGEHRPGDLAPARDGIAASTDLSGGARLRSGRAGRQPASPTWTRATVAVDALCGAHDGSPQRLRGTVVPAPASGEPSGEPRQRVGSVGKAVVNLSRTSRRQRSNANPHGSKGPRERVRLLER